MLGDCYLTIGGSWVSGVTGGFFRIAAYLILSGTHGIVPRHRLSALLWSDADGEKAAANLRQALVRIRRLQEEQAFQLIESNFSTIYLVPDHGVRCDLIDLVDHRSHLRPVSAAKLAELYRGDLLIGLEESGDGYEEWLAPLRDQMRMGFIDEMTAAVGSDSELAPADRAACARRLLVIDPYSEDAVRALMREAAEHKQMVRLNHLYSSISALLAKDLGVAPSGETQRLYARLQHLMHD